MNDRQTTMKAHALSVGQVLSRLDVTLDAGLSSAEVTRRRRLQALRHSIRLPGRGRSEGNLLVFRARLKIFN
jgi:hypothetical protein